MDATTGLLDRIDLLATSLAAHAGQNDKTGKIPRNVIAEISSSGVLGLTVPRDLGGAGAGVLETSDVLRRLAQSDPSVALILSMHFIQHLIIALSPSWPGHLTHKLVDDALAGKGFVNALRVERLQGSPSRGGLPETTARRTSEGWRLTGHKIYSTGALLLDWYLVWAKTDNEVARVGAFLVPAGLPGTKIVETWDHLGMRASGSHDVFFDDVKIPADHEIELRLPEEWRTAEPIQGSLYPLLIGAVYDGIAQSARNWLVRFLNARTPSSLGAPLATLGRVQEAVGEIEARLAVNNRLIRTFARDFDKNGMANAIEAGLIKLSVTNNAISVVEEALRLTGNHGLSRNNPLERHHRDVLCGRVHAPQDDSVRIALGLHALKQ